MIVKCLFIYADKWQTWKRTLIICYWLRRSVMYIYKKIKIVPTRPDPTLFCPLPIPIPIFSLLDVPIPKPIPIFLIREYRYRYRYRKKSQVRYRYRYRKQLLAQYRYRLKAHYRSITTHEGLKPRIRCRCPF